MYTVKKLETRNPETEAIRIEFRPDPLPAVELERIEFGVRNRFILPQWPRGGKHDKLCKE